MPTAQPSVILASGSPRRSELLDAWGIAYRVRTSGVDEAFDAEWEPARLVSELAMRKAISIAAEHADAIVIGADTTVVVDGTVLNKPDDAADARRMLRLLRGRPHEVWTGIALVRMDQSVRITSAVRSLVRMRAYTDEEIDTYVATGEPLDKAGAYAIQGGAGVFVAEIEGCYANVVGLPMCELAGALAGLSVSVITSRPVCARPDGAACPRLTER